MKTLNEDVANTSESEILPRNLGLVKALKASPMQLCTYCVEKGMPGFFPKEQLTKFGNRRLCPNHLKHVKEVYANRAKNK